MSLFDMLDNEAFELPQDVQDVISKDPDVIELGDDVAEMEQRSAVHEPPFSLTSEVAGGPFSNQEILDDAFRWFRANGFPYRVLPRFVMLQQVNQLAHMPMDALRSTPVAYSVADHFHPHRFHATVTGKVSPLECFCTDEKFRHALRLRLERNPPIPAGFFGELTLARGTQQCSNFRPGFACWMYRRFCQRGATILDTSTGYGGRLVGYVAAMLHGRYLGIDPNTMTHAGNLALAKTLNVGDEVTLYNLPAEEVEIETIGRERCDFAFTSPPYFSKEHYSDEETQSWKRYGGSLSAWTQGFLEPMLRLTYAALKPSCYSVINIEDVTVDNEYFPLVSETIRLATAVGFTHQGTELFEMQPRLGAHQDEAVATERVLIFQK